MSFYDVMYALGLGSAKIMFFMGLGVPISIWLSGHLVPKHLKQKYLRPPWFHEGDDDLFEWNYFCRQQLTLALLCYTSSRWFAKRRNIEMLRDDCPLWWRIYAWFALWVFIVLPIASFLILLIVMGYFKTFVEP